MLNQIMNIQYALTNTSTRNTENSTIITTKPTLKQPTSKPNYFKS